MPNPEEEPEALCERTRAAIARFVDGGLTQAAARDMRAHLVGCPPCRTLYRETIASAARIGHGLRVEREEAEREDRRTSLRERTIQATAEGKRRRRFGLRLALLPAVFGLLVLILRSSADDPLIAHWRGGEVRVAGQRMNDDRAALRLEPGEWVETGGQGLALLAPGLDAPAEDEVVPCVLSGPTALQVVDPAARVLRLEHGRLELVGPGRVVTPHGILDVERGMARLAVGPDGVELLCEAGEVQWTGPRGTSRLRAGERLQGDALSAGTLAGVGQ